MILERSIHIFVFMSLDINITLIVKKEKAVALSNSIILKKIEGFRHHQLNVLLYFTVQIISKNQTKISIEVPLEK